MEQNALYVKPCVKCGKAISLKNLKRHERSCSVIHQCCNCAKVFTNQYNGLRHESICIESLKEKKPKLWEPQKKTLINAVGEGIHEYETAFGNRLHSWFIRSKECTDMKCFLNDRKPEIVNVIKNALVEHTSIKVNLVVECTFQNMIGEETDRAFKTRNKAVFQETDLIKFYDDCIDKLQNEMDIAEMKKSGWTLKEVDCIRVKINKNNPLRGSSYIPLPAKIEAKKACINVKNNDYECFRYAILSKFVKKNAQRVNNYRELEHNYNFLCVSYPTPLYEIERFEQINNISVNVFGLEEGEKLYPIKVVKEELPDHRDLLLLNNDSGGTHYIYIKSFEKLVHMQLTQHKPSISICKRCFSTFDDQYGTSKEDKLLLHKNYCEDYKVARVELPFKKPYLKFENVERVLRVPYVIYADFEALLEPIAGCQPNPLNSYTKKYQKHTPMSYCFYVKASDEMQHVPSLLPTEPVIYRGKNAASHFMQQLKVIGEEISRLYSLNTPMELLTEEEESSFEASNMCYVCETLIGEEVKVRDHSHITGKYRGPAHNSCNLRCRSPSFIPVLLHNLSGYDSHFIVKELGYDDRNIEVIPNSEEKYISFSKRINEKIKLRFIDSFRFMSSSLDSLVKNVPHLKETSKFYPKEVIALLKRKGVFPYDYIDSWKKLEETCLPPKEMFYNKLNGNNISDEDYKHAHDVWNYFGFKTLAEYSNHYLKIDVLQLVDIFQNFRDTIHQNYKLDPCHYFTTPGLTWDAMLKYTGIRLSLLTDYDMILMIEKGIRGGLCQVSHRYVKSNNYFLKDFNPNEESSYITYQDCTNLYGYAMSKPLPYGDFYWTDSTDLDNMKEDDEEGCILEVDLEYPPNLHRLHNDIPFLPESMSMDGGKNKKLVAHLGVRTKYIVHYMALKQALEHGLKLVKIHRVLKFKQSRWLSTYVNFNAHLRKNSKNDFEKDLFKLMNNAVFGKTMENIRQRLNIQLVSDSKKIEKLISRPDFIDRTIYSENLVAVHRLKRSIVFNKPIYVGMSILDISKTVMYNYHYQVMLPRYGPERLRLTYMDTDSFIYHIKTVDFYTDMLDMLEYMDTSDYPTNHPCYSIKNKKVMGTFKDEMQGKIILAFAGLRAKMYSIYLGDREIKKIKGISKNVVQRDISFKDYVNCLFSKDLLLKPMNFIQSQKHNIYTSEINKVALSPFDNKRQILPDGISTLALGYNHKED